MYLYCTELIALSSNCFSSQKKKKIKLCLLNFLLGNCFKRMDTLYNSSRKMPEFLMIKMQVLSGHRVRAG